MKKLLFITTVIVLLTSCVKERFGFDGDEQNVELTLQLDTRGVSGTADDNTINKIRFIVVGSNGDIKFNNLVTYKSTGIYKIEAPTGNGNTFYVICNETTELASALTALTDGEDLEKMQTTLRTIAPPLIMFGCVNNVTVVAGADNENTVSYTDENGNGVTGAYVLPISLKRLASKISLTFIRNSSDNFNNITISDFTIKVISVPTRSYLRENNPYDIKVTDGSTTITKSAVGSLATDNTATFSTLAQEFTYGNGDKVTFDSFYIPEYIIAQANQGNRDYETAILVSAKCTSSDDQVIQGNWRINLMDGGNIYRNTHYKIAATISGFGAIGIYADIVPVTQWDIPINWKPVDGLVIVGDRVEDYNATGKMKNINVWNDYDVYWGLLKVYHEATGYTDILFKYGSVVGTKAIEGAGGISYTPPVEGNWGDITWIPSSFDLSSFYSAPWASLPYTSDTSGEIAHDQTTVSAGKGDPCRLVGLSAEQIRDGIVDNGVWHMATPDELQRLVDNYDGALRAPYVGFPTYHSMIIPATPTRDQNGELNSPAGTGQYWSSAYAKAFTFDDSKPNNIPPMEGKVLTESNLHYGFTVRCVRNKIPETTLAVTKPANTTYQGDITDGKSFSISTNMPYWTAELTKVTGYLTPDNEAQNKMDFSFEPGANSNVTKVEGSGNKSLKVYIKRKEIPTGNRRYFYITVKGMGYDGRLMVHEIVAEQTAYQWNVLGVLTPSPLTLPYGRLPMAETEYTVIMNITPTDIEIPADANWKIYTDIEFGSNNVIAHSTAVQITPGKYDGYIVTVKIPANTTPDVRGLTFWFRSSGIPNANPNNTHFYQNNK